MAKKNKMFKVKKAKDFPIGTRFLAERLVKYGMGGSELVKIPVTLVAYSRQGDEVVILEADDDDGNVFLMNVNDLLPEDYVDPAIPFTDHLMSVLFKETTSKYNLEIVDQSPCCDPKSFQVENTVDGSIFEVTVVCKNKPSED